MTKATVLITGANRGLGLALARALAGRGFDVIGTARRAGEAADLAACGAEVFELDVASDPSIASFRGALGDRPIDVLVNNAGILGNEGQAVRHGPHFGGLARADFARVFDVNTTAPLMLVQALHENIEAGARKHVVNISSSLGSLEEAGSSEPWAYRASKSALNMVTRSMSMEPRLGGWTVVAVHPGWVRTAMGGEEGELSAEESAAGLAVFIESLDPDRNGGFFDRFGERLPW